VVCRSLEKKCRYEANLLIFRFITIKKRYHSTGKFARLGRLVVSEANWADRNSAGIPVTHLF
jgi:hypothetical protein